MFKKIFFFIISLFVFWGVSSNYLLAKNPHFFHKKNVVLKGYDVVAYFVANKAKKGLKSFSKTYKNVNWYFSSKENLEKFSKNPLKYLPQYGGFCTYAASRGYKAGVDPKQFIVYKKKLYLNYNATVHKTVINNIDFYVKKADQNWNSIKNEK